MRRAARWTAFAAVLAVACSPKLEVPPGAMLSCTASSECPSGQACHAGFCVDPAKVDTVPPDLAAAPVVSPSLGRAFTTFTVGLTVTEELAIAPTLILGLDVPVQVPCTGGSGLSYTCAYTATGVENGGLGGNVPFDVRLLDPAMNEVTKRLAGTLRLDFEPPDVLPGSASLALGPPAGSPLRSVGAAGPGATVQVAFTVDEALAADPTVVASGAGTALSLAKLGEAGQSYLYEAVLADPHPGQGSYAVSVSLVDVAGNAATRTLALPGAGLVVDTVAPVVPDTARAGAIVYRRVPWGSEETAGQTLFDVTGAAGAVEPNDVVQILDGPDPASAAELGRGQAGGDGSFGPIAIGRADHAVVYVAAVDAAANRSAVADVKDVRWVASLGGKVPGSLMANPTTLVSTPFLAPVATQDRSALEPDEASLRATTLADGVSATRVAEQRWAARDFGTAGPLPRRQHAMAYDSDRGKIVIFGGDAYGAGGRLTDTWEWDGVAGVWSDRTLPAGVSPPADHLSGLPATAMVYDQRRQRMLLYVGDDDAGHSSTWEWDPASGYWFDRSPPPGAPSPGHRMLSAMAYDGRRGRAVLFGGQYIGGGGSNSTWEWDGDAGTWIERLPEGAPGSPSIADQPAMTYDAARGKVVLWGWVGPADPAEIWEWDGGAGSWTHRADVATPPGILAPAMAYDAARHVLVSWGGSEQVSSDPHRLWEWDPSGVASWADRTPSGAVPCGVEQSGLAYDVLRNRSVLFGGYSHTCGSSIAVLTNQVWDWTASPLGAPGTWTNRTGAGRAAPGPRRNAAMAYDPVRKKVVLYGGEWDGGVAGAQRQTLRSDTWELDPVTGSWTEFVVSPSPGPRSQGAMAYDAARGAMILFSGEILDPYWGYRWDDQTWAWNGSAWTKLSPAASPSMRYGHAMVGIVRGGAPRILLFGGSETSLSPLVGTTWEWDGAANAGAGNWTNVTPAGGPSTREYPGLAWDSDRQLAVLYGGDDRAAGTPKNDLWTWTGSAWSPVPVSSAPPPRGGASEGGVGFVYDTSRRKLLLWGGFDDTQFRPLSDVWEWDAASGSTGWIERTPSSGAPARFGMAAYYDPVRRAVLMVGGDAELWSPMKGDAWEWQSGAGDRAAFVWTVPWSATGERSATVLGLEVTASAAGSGNDGGYPAGPIGGASILGWDLVAGMWRTLAWNTATGAPAAMTYATADGQSVAGIVAGATRPITIAVTPLASNAQGTSLSRVTLDQLQLAVRYRRAP